MYMHTFCQVAVESGIGGEQKKLKTFCCFCMLSHPVYPQGSTLQSTNNRHQNSLQLIREHWAQTFINTCRLKYCEALNNLVMMRHHFKRSLSLMRWVNRLVKQKMHGLLLLLLLLLAKQLNLGVLWLASYSWLNHSHPSAWLWLRCCYACLLLIDYLPFSLFSC